jgi:hypothetical protein
LVAVLRLFRSRGVYLVLAVLCCAVSRFLVGLFVPVCLCPLSIVLKRSDFVLYTFVRTL